MLHILSAWKFKAKCERRKVCSGREEAALLLHLLWDELSQYRSLTYRFNRTANCFFEALDSLSISATLALGSGYTSRDATKPRAESLQIKVIPYENDTWLREIHAHSKKWPFPNNRVLLIYRNTTCCTAWATRIGRVARSIPRALLTEIYYNSSYRWFVDLFAQVRDCREICMTSYNKRNMYLLLCFWLIVATKSISAVIAVEMSVVLSCGTSSTRRILRPVTVNYVIMFLFNNFLLSLTLYITSRSPILPL